MKRETHILLVDNGSYKPEAVLNLRNVAKKLSLKSSKVINLMDGYKLSPVRINTKPISKGDFRRNVTEGSMHLLCWMTMAQVKKMRTQKVVFEDLR